MRYITFGILATILLSITSCQKEETKNADDLLIEAIKNATNKQSINPQELPSGTKITLETDYFDSYVDEAKKAPKLGYEVDMRCDMGPKNGDYSQVYFDIDGRELKSYKGDKGGKGDKGDKGDKDCFDFVYPITYVMPDETTITGNNKEEIRIAIKAWYEANPDSQQKPSLQYPVDIVFGDKVITVNNDEEMHRIYKACKGDKGGKKKCFVIIYPVTYILPDESQVTVVSKDDKEAWETIKAWYVANPDVTQRPMLDFPVDIKWKTGEITTINNQDEMRRAKKKCNGDKEKCFELNFPVTYVMPDETEITVLTNDEEGWADIKAWYIENPDSKKRPSIVFPVDITFKDGSQATINNRDEMKRAFKSCE